MLKAFGIVTSKHDLLGKLQKTLFNFRRYPRCHFLTQYTNSFCRIHAGVSSTMSQNCGLMLPESAFAAALKEYEDDSETEEDGEDID